jgi:hypothetical protein
MAVPMFDPTSRWFAGIAIDCGTPARHRCQQKLPREVHLAFETPVWRVGMQLRFCRRLSWRFRCDEIRGRFGTCGDWRAPRSLNFGGRRVKYQGIQRRAQAIG